MRRLQLARAAAFLLLAHRRRRRRPAARRRATRRLLSTSAANDGATMPAAANFIARDSRGMTIAYSTPNLAHVAAAAADAKPTTQNGERAASSPRQPLPQRPPQSARSTASEDDETIAYADAADTITYTRSLRLLDTIAEVSARACAPIDCKTCDC